jgi:hypothetical protein
VRRALALLLPLSCALWLAPAAELRAQQAAKSAPRAAREAAPAQKPAHEAAPRRAHGSDTAPRAAAAPAAPSAGEAPPSGDLPALWRDSRRLEAEAELAQKPKSYFVLDLAARRVAVKARGMDLLRIPVEETGYWGRRLTPGPTALVAKESLKQPARPQIRPGEEKKDETLDEQILEVKDMPTAYHLRLEDGLDVQVLPAAEPGFWPQLRRRLRFWRWGVERALATLRERREHRETRSLYLVLQPEAARALYWSLYEGIEGVIVPR